MQLVEESCIAQCEGDYRKALSKAKEASNKERHLIRLQEQSGLGDHHNIDLTYAVSSYIIYAYMKIIFLTFLGFIQLSKSVCCK